MVDTVKIAKEYNPNVTVGNGFEFNTDQFATWIFNLIERLDSISTNVGAEMALELDDITTDLREMGLTIQGVDTDEM